MSKKSKLVLSALATVGITVVMAIPGYFLGYTGVSLAIIPLTITVFYFGFTRIDNNDERIGCEQELLKRLEHMEQELAKLAGERDDSAQGAAQQQPKADSEE